MILSSEYLNFDPVKSVLMMGSTSLRCRVGVNDVAGLFKNRVILIVLKKLEWS